MTESWTLLAGDRTRCTPPLWQQREPVHDDHHRLYFPRRGRAWFEAGEQRIELEPGTIAFLPGHRSVRFGCHESFELDWLHFRAEPLARDLRLGRCPATEWPESEWSCLRPIVTRIRPAIRGEDPVSARRLRALIELLVAGVEPTESDPGPDLEPLAPAIALMDARFTESPSLAEVAAAAAMSPSHFHRRFKAAFGLTPHAYMARQRLRLARRWLHESEAPIGAIAEAAGFGDPYYFSRAFRRAYGVPPREARRQGWRPLP